MISEYDTDRNGTIDFHEFLTLMACKRKEILFKKDTDTED